MSTWPPCGSAVTWVRPSPARGTGCPASSLALQPEQMGSRHCHDPACGPEPAACGECGEARLSPPATPPASPRSRRGRRGPPYPPHGATTGPSPTARLLPRDPLGNGGLAGRTAEPVPRAPGLARSRRPGEPRWTLCVTHLSGSAGSLRRAGCSLLGSHHSPPACSGAFVLVPWSWALSHGDSGSGLCVLMGPHFTSEGKTSSSAPRADLMLAHRCPSPSGGQGQRWAPLSPCWDRPPRQQSRAVL